MTYKEQECVERLIKAMRQNSQQNLSSQEKEATYSLLADAYGAFDTFEIMIERAS